jgi:hypothetical protein
MSGAEILPLAMAGASAGATLFSTAKSAEAQEASKEQLALKREADIAASRESYDAYQFESRQYDRQGKQIRIAAAQDEANRYDKLTSSLDTIAAIRAGRGLDLDSPTGRAIRQGQVSDALADIDTSRANSRIAEAQTKLASELAMRKSRFALLQGYYGAVSNDAAREAADAGISATLAGGIGKVAGIGMDLYRQRVRA